jgi:hypothetical protein
MRSLVTKKRHERFIVRAGRPVTQLTSSSGTATMPPPSLEYIQGTIDSVESKYKNRNYFLSPRLQSYSLKLHLRTRHCRIDSVSGITATKKDRIL